jgi:hypothetical protein
VGARLSLFIMAQPSECEISGNTAGRGDTTCADLDKPNKKKQQEETIRRR